MSDFQTYLKNKGWKRYYMDYHNRKNPEKVYSDSMMLSSYGPTEFIFEHDDYPDVILWWGLWLKDKPPVFCLNRITILHEDKYRVDQDLWFDVMKILDHDTIYDLLLNEGTVRIEDDKITVK